MCAIVWAAAAQERVRRRPRIQNDSRVCPKDFPALYGRLGVRQTERQSSHADWGSVGGNASAISLRALMEARRHPAFRALGQSHDGIAVIDREQAPVYDAARSGAQRPAFS